LFDNVITETEKHDKLKAGIAGRHAKQHDSNLFEQRDGRLASRQPDCSLLLVEVDTNYAWRRMYGLNMTHLRVCLASTFRRTILLSYGWISSSFSTPEATHTAETTQNWWWCWTI